MYEPLYLLAGVAWIWMIFWWLVASIVVAVVASDKGRSGFGYFLLAIFLSPLFAGLILAGASDSKLAATSGVNAKDFREGVESLWKQLEAIRLQLVSLRAGIALASPALPAGALPALQVGPTVPADTGMGYCPGCQRLRGLASPKCIYCSSTEPAAATK